MGTTTATYRFNRPAKSVFGIGRRVLPSTDAHSAFETWSIRAPGRSVKVIEEGDEFVVVELSLGEGDTNVATDLNVLCLEHGVELHAV